MIWLVEKFSLTEGHYEPYLVFDSQYAVEKYFADYVEWTLLDSDAMEGHTRKDDENRTSYYASPWPIIDVK